MVLCGPTTRDEHGIVSCIGWRHSFLTASTYSSFDASSNLSRCFQVLTFLPLSIHSFLPFKLIPLLDIRNTTLLITLGAQAPLIVFRCLQALFNTSPPYAETSLRYFLLYHTSPVGFVFDTNTNAIRQFSRRELLGKVRNLLTSIISVTLLMNLLLSTNFAPFPSREISNLTDYFYWGNLANRYLMAYLLGTYLESGTIAAAIAISLISGFSTVDFNDSPLTKSTSVAEFWGYRWNKVVGGYLKFAVFKPVLKSGWNKVLAVIATFFASGLLHEYVLLCCTLKGGQGFPVQPKYFRQTGFFLWNGMMLILEQYLTSAKGARQIASKLPGAFRTALVVMTSLPISHWFIDEFTAAGVLNDFSVAFPRIRKIS
jgi:hypothetical protein